MVRYFQIVPSGVIKGGDFNYEFNAENKLLTYKTTVKVGKFGMSKNFEAAGHQNIEPEQLESSKYSTVGAAIEFANLKGNVMKIDGQVATANVYMTDMDAKGTATFDISGQYVSLLTLDAEGKVKVPVLGKMNFHLILQPAIKPLAKKDVIIPVEEPKQEAGENGEVQPEKP